VPPKSISRNAQRHGGGGGGQRKRPPGAAQARPGTAGVCHSALPLPRPWTPQDAEKLRALVTREGLGNWQEKATVHFDNSRSAKSLEAYYYRHLR
jgi:hypothetical protein